MEKRMGIVHGVEKKECVVDRAGLKTNAMDKLVDRIDMNVPRDQTRVRPFADYLRGPFSIIYFQLHMQRQRTKIGLKHRMEKALDAIFDIMFNVNKMFNKHLIFPTIKA